MSISMKIIKYPSKYVYMCGIRWHLTSNLFVQSINHTVERHHVGSWTSLTIFRKKVACGDNFHRQSFHHLWGSLLKRCHCHVLIFIERSEKQRLVFRFVLWVALFFFSYFNNYLVISVYIFKKGRKVCVEFVASRLDSMLSCQETFDNSLSTTGSLSTSIYFLFS